MKQITCPHCADTYPDFDVAHVCSKGPYAPKIKPKMNERIRELAAIARGQAIVGTTVDEEQWKQHEQFVEKFAELIVRECANIADIAEPFLASDLIKQHFGVEE